MSCFVHTVMQLKITGIKKEIHVQTYPMVACCHGWKVMANFQQVLPKLLCLNYLLISNENFRRISLYFQNRHEYVAMRKIDTLEQEERLVF